MDPFFHDDHPVQPSANESVTQNESESDSNEDDSDPDYNFAKDDHNHDEDEDHDPHDNCDDLHSSRKNTEENSKPKGKVKVAKYAEPEAEEAAEPEQEQEPEPEVEPETENEEMGKQLETRTVPAQPLDQLEAQRISKEIAAQCRSYFYGVRRKYNHRTGKFSPFFAEMRKPDEVMSVSDFATVNINIKGFKTDVEAAVACSVLIDIFKTHVEKTRNADKASYRPGENDPRVIVLKCHPILVQRRLDKMKQKKGFAKFPDCTLHHKIQKFCRKCADDFLQIALDVKNGLLKMPEDPSLADAVTRYINEAWPASETYPPDKIPAQKQSMPSVVKRKFDNLEGIVGVKKMDRGSFIELECCCDQCPQPRRLRWEVKPDGNVCVCHGIRYSIQPVSNPTSF